MKFTGWILTFIVLIFTSCGPIDQQPVFNTSNEIFSTAMPGPASAPKVVATLPGVIWSFDISPDQATLAVATSKGLVVYDMKTFSQLHMLDIGENEYSLSWSPTGNKLALGLMIPFEDGGQAVLEIFDTKSWKMILQPEFRDNLKNERILNIAWNPEGSALALSTDMHGVLVVDAVSGKILSTQTGFASSVMEAAWSPDGSRLISTSDMAYSLRRWKVSSGKAVRLFDQRVGNPWHVLWMKDGKRIVSGHVYGTVCFWSVATNKCDGFIQAQRTAVFSMALSGDDARLATAGGVIRVWDTQNGKMLTEFGLVDKFIYTHLAWINSDQAIAALQTGLDDPEITSIRFWNIGTGTASVEFSGGKR